MLPGDWNVMALAPTSGSSSQAQPCVRLLSGLWLIDGLQLKALFSRSVTAKVMAAQHCSHKWDRADIRVGAAGLLNPSFYSYGCPIYFS